MAYSVCLWLMTTTYLLLFSVLQQLGLHRSKREGLCTITDLEDLDHASASVQVDKDTRTHLCDLGDLLKVGQRRGMQRHEVDGGAGRRPGRVSEVHDTVRLI